MDWQTLLSPRRLGKLDEPLAARGPRSPFQRDYDRILFSAAFRRLQDKTQVFPLAKDDYVRTRLTHSLEVSTVGRSLGAMVGDAIVQRHPDLQTRGITAADFGTIVAAACLAHDIGNPPFGHAGESAIQDWFTRQGTGSEYLDKHCNGAQEKADFQKFEGNAQGFRVLTRIQSSGQEGGMQLTCAVLGAYSKYPRASIIESPNATNGISGKKFGFVQQDQKHFEQVAEAVGLMQKGDPCAWYRHPLAFLVEAADDICYRIMDVEDGFRTGHLAYSEIEGLFAPVVGGESMSRANALGSEKQRVEYLRAKAIDTAIRQAVQVFVDNEDALLAGTYDREILADIPLAEQYRAFKALAKRKVYCVKPVVEIEACGFRVLAGLLECFLDAVDDAASKGNAMSARSRSVTSLLPYGSWREGMSTVERLHAATDTVSGMTDSFALATYQRLYGIRLS
ncbi:MAG: deoxyguanosinetriphosphate triphosphohydrolase [Rhodocyclaceae bacterium]|nr:deoxyguanosinetriphosphate triphosphohydrolase [Rhodocyclaceae bacterium]